MVQKGCDPQQEAQLLVLNPRDCLVCSLVTWLVGQGAPSTSLLVVQNWGEWLVQQRVLLPSRRTLTGERNRLVGPLGSYGSTRTLLLCSVDPSSVGFVSYKMANSL